MSTRSPSPAHLMTTQAAAEYLAVSPDTVRRMISDGRLTGYRVGRSVRVLISEVKRVPQRIPAAPSQGGVQ